jgi:hypothetical protein
MKIITAADNKFKDIVKLSQIQNSKFKYETTIYSINNSLGFGEEFSLFEFSEMLSKINNQFIPIGRIPYKPHIIKKALESYKTLIGWLDADAFIIKNIDELNNNDYDIAITIRGKEEIKDSSMPILNGYINAGVCFFDYNNNVLNFIDKWINQVYRTRFLSDQEALNILVGEILDMNNLEYNRIYETPNLRIKVLDTKIYNYYYYPKLPPKETKIIHVKNNIRKDPKSLEWFSKDWN